MKKSGRCLGVCCLAAFFLYAAQASVGTQVANVKEAVLYTATNGNDQNPGTLEKPFATLERAKAAVRELVKTSDKPIRVFVREGVYYLNGPLEFRSEDSGSAAAPVTYSAYTGERVTLSGGRRLNCKWKKVQNGIMACELPEVKEGILDFTQLFVNGRRQVRARYPNFDNSRPGKSGYINPVNRIPDTLHCPLPGPNDDIACTSRPPRGILFDPSTFTKKRWARPQEAVLHIYHSGYWGSLQWAVRTIDCERQAIWFGEGGHQMGAKWNAEPASISKNSRFFIENVFEELDAPGEWYLDREKAILYFLPQPGVDLSSTLVEAPVLEQVVRFAGTHTRPVAHVSLEGFRIAHTAATFMNTYEVPSLSDWAIHRGGAVFLEGARNVGIRNCWFDGVGGNGVFLNKFNRGNNVTGCTFTEAGESAIAFVGSLELTSGTQLAFPYECSAHNNLIHDCGVFGKQIAGVYISRAKRITASHNLIYNMPRAAICIGDGTWGGHVIEFNHCHDTVRETGDHGPFNSWGRDKYWCLAQSHLPYSTYRSIEAGNVVVDAMEPVIIRNNFFEEKPESIEGIHGPVFGLDLDDGASNYEIYNNITKNISMKLREGANRTVYNNIWYNSVVSPCFHVGNEYNHDRYFNNITVMSKNDVYSIIAPPARGPWLEELDRNCLYSRSGEFTAELLDLRGEEGPIPGRIVLSLREWKRLGFDRNSVFADPQFVDPSKNDFRVKPESPALKVGFKNFEMGKWGLTEEFPGVWRE